ncbi:KTSC domain-containing protein [Chamaesiphon polymorphus]|uniref:KTSC domain-containing protein n=1 Tax=Chamaesiphon polymorphus CCALA 037 TaxID=2107692 RepID=A0A2T1GAQ2_9CYAN|nr:KTSC domain-containing protein [Chamaesiphon polymorphus]PSB54356.1 KTSC domain-containing protein [Chamaesiphon polymorphus CCALA 037]
MKLSKIDLSSLKAIAHDEDGLKLLIEREDEIEYIEIPAPLAAYEGLQLLDRIIASTPEIEPYEEHIEMLPAHSTMAAQVGYDYDREILQIEFNSGAVYQYSEVEPELWEDLQATDSIGSFYNQEIKGYYPSTRIE